MLDVVMEVFALLFDIVLALLDSVRRALFGCSLRDLRGEKAVVTGAGHGIGRELALQLSRLGVRVVLWDINGDSCAAVKDEIELEGGEAWDMRVDVSNREAVAEAARASKELVGGQITLLVNNAGIMPAKPFLEFKPADVEKLFAVNVYSQMWTLHEFLPDMLEADKGLVLSMCSMAGVTGTPFLTPYASTKFAVKGLMDSLFLELRQERPGTSVRFTTVHPFTVNTGLAKDAYSRFSALVPIMEADETARIAIEALRADEEEVFVPRRLWLAGRAGKCLPRKAQLALMDFLSCGVGRSDK